MGCPRCANDVALHEGKPVVAATGAIELWHPSCWSVRDAHVEQVAIVAPRARGRFRFVAAMAAAIAACVLGAAHARATRHPSASLAAIDMPDKESVSVKTILTSREAQMPTLPLEEQFPSLVDWIHPVTGSAEHMPEQPSRHFGAERKGIERAECGAGHCGVDLDGPRGRPVVAVADGVVVRVERHELGLDGRSGRYVRIEHDDGTLTAYMHLDDIAEGLEVGDHVDGGQYIGTLGATAVYRAAPHLHFSLEIPNRAGEHGDNTNTHYVDPAPFLARAKIVSIPDRHHAIKPAM
jgi:murein DD-endopeptidase MepM/ murein hydrolase activator NlpD